jgi:hypothetical protein
MIVGIGGSLGSGKTLRLTALGLWVKQQVPTFTILSNYWTAFSDQIINPLDLMTQRRKLNNCILLLTEAHTFLDSRLSGTRANLYQSYFFLQTRKMRTHVFYDSQFLDAVDKRLRTICDYAIECHSEPKHSTTKTEFNYKWWTPDNYSPIPDHDETWYTKQIYPLFNYYNTYEVMSPFSTVEDIPFHDVKDVYVESPSKKSFVAYLRAKYPSVTHDLANGMYDWLKDGKDHRAKEMLERAFSYEF